MPLQVTRQVFEASKGRLKVVGRAGVGVDNVDLAAATEVRRGGEGRLLLPSSRGRWGDGLLAPSIPTEVHGAGGGGPVESQPCQPVCTACQVAALVCCIQARKPPPQHAHTRVPPAPCRLQFGCLVVNAPTANTVAAAEHGIALMTALARNVAQADASMKAGKWERNKYVGVSMVDKVLAIMGFGKVRRQAPAGGQAGTVAAGRRDSAAPSQGWLAMNSCAGGGLGDSKCVSVTHQQQHVPAGVSANFLLLP